MFVSSEGNGALPLLLPNSRSLFFFFFSVNSKLSPLNPTPPPPRPPPNKQPHKFDSSSNRIDRVCTTTSNPITGTFLIPSTGVFVVGDYSFASGLDAFGKLTKFEISPDETCVTSVMMNTGFYNQSLAAGKIIEGVLFKDTVPPREKCKLSAPMCNLNGPNDNVFVNTVQLNDGRIVAVTDSPTWLTVEGETLTIGERLPFSKIESGQIGMLGSGHPLWVPIGGKDTLVGLEVAEGMMNPDVLVYSVDSTDERSTLATLNPSSLVEKSGKWMPYFHSFGITHSPEARPDTTPKVVLPLQPLGVNMLNLMTSALMSEAFDEVPELETFKITFAPLDGGDDNWTTYTSTVKFYYVHVVNSYEEEDWTIVVYLTSFGINPFLTTLVDLEVARNGTKLAEEAAASKAARSSGAG